MSFQGISDELHQQIYQLVKQGKKLHAVKLIVESTPKGLKEAKDYVDWVEKGIRKR